MTTAANIAPIALADGSLYLIADDKLLNKGTELWTSDGKTTGTKLVMDIAPGSAGSAVKYLYAFDDEVCFSATAGGNFNNYSAMSLPDP